MAPTEAILSLKEACEAAAVVPESSLPNENWMAGELNAATEISADEPRPDRTGLEPRASARGLHPNKLLSFCLAQPRNENGSSDAGPRNVATKRTQQVIENTEEQKVRTPHSLRNGRPTNEPLRR